MHCALLCDKINALSAPENPSVMGIYGDGTFFLMSGLRYQLLTGASDRRGEGYHIPQRVLAFMDRIEEMHFVTIEPGAVRGNHYHKDRKEFMFVYHDGPFLLAWSSLGVQDPTIQEFDGRGAVIVEIDSEIVHAVKNKGANLLHIVSCSDAPYAVADTERVMILD